MWNTAQISRSHATTVELFNLVLELKLSVQEKNDLVAFMRTL